MAEKKPEDVAKEEFISKVLEWWNAMDPTYVGAVRDITSKDPAPPQKRKRPPSFHVPKMNWLEHPIAAFSRLGIRPSANAKDVRAAHRRLAKKTHPDQGGNRAEFEEVEKAYKIALDWAEKHNQ